MVFPPEQATVTIPERGPRLPDARIPPPPQPPARIPPEAVTWEMMTLYNPPRCGDVIAMDVFLADGGTSCPTDIPTALRDGWEPFAVQRLLADGAVHVYYTFRRKV